MKRIKFFSSVAVALVLLLSVLLSAESAALANSAALYDVDPLRTVPCFKALQIDLEPNPDLNGSLWAKANWCTDCKAYFFIHVDGQSVCIPRFEGTIQ